MFFSKKTDRNSNGIVTAKQPKVSDSFKKDVIKLSYDELKKKYKGLISSQNSYQGTGYGYVVRSPKQLLEDQFVMKRYRELKREADAKQAAHMAELYKYHYLNLYKHILETGRRPDGTPATDLEKKIAPYVPLIPIIQAGVGAYTTRQFIKYESSLNSSQVNSQKSQSLENKYEPFVPDAKYSKKLPQNVSPGIKYLHKYDANGVIKQTKFYDDYGRQIGWVDYSDHGHPNNHSNPHWHQIIYNKDTPGTGYKIDYRFEKNIPYDFGGNQ